MKRFVSIMLSVMLALAVGATFTGCAKPPAKVATSHVNLDVNPEIELILDQNNKVMSVKCANEDAQVLLYGEVSLEGMDVEKAVEYITNLAIENGFLDDSNTVVNTSVSSDSATVEAEILGKVNAKITATAQQLSLNVTTTDELAYSVLRAYEKYIEQNPTEVISARKFELAYKTAKEYGMDIDEAVKMSTAEKVKALEEKYGELEVYMNEAFMKARNTALNTYDLAASSVLDSIYATYYTTHRLGNLKTGYYGIAYQAYRVAAANFGAAAKIVNTINKNSEYALDTTEVSALMAELDISDVNLIADGNGDVTLDTVNNYVDKVYKNLDTEQAKTEFRASYEQVLTELEGDVASEIAAGVKTHISELDSALQSVENMLESIPAADFMTGFADMVEPFRTAMAELDALVESGNILNEAKLNEIAEMFADEAEDVLGKINADLSAEEKQEVEGLYDNVESALTAYRTQLESVLDTAEQEAREYLAALKAGLSE